MDDTEQMITELNRVMTNAGMSEFQKKLQASRARQRAETEALANKVEYIKNNEAISTEDAFKILRK